MNVVRDMPPTKEMAEFRAMLDGFWRKLPLFKELNAAEAQLTRQKYLDLIKAGFTEQQALDLCKTWKG